MEHASEAELMGKIHKIYMRMDLDESGAVNLDELNEGLKKMSPGGRPLRLSTEDFNIATENGKFLNSDGELGYVGFQNMLLNQLRLYTNRKIVDAFTKAEDDSNSELLFALRMIMANVEQTHLRVMRMDPGVYQSGLI